MPSRLRLRLAPVLLLAGCASPSAGYLGVTPQRLVIEGTEIHVWQRGDRAQAIRMGYAPRAAQGAVMARMVAATELATGCTLRPGSAEGDSAVLDTRLDC